MHPNSEEERGAGLGMQSQLDSHLINPELSPEPQNERVQTVSGLLKM